MALKHFSLQECLDIAFELFCIAGSPIHVILPVLKDLRESVPKALRIWEHSPIVLSHSIPDPTYKRTLLFEEYVKKLLSTKMVTEQTVVIPPWVEVHPLLRYVGFMGHEGAS